MSTIERLYKLSSTLPPAALAELLDFAEFLHQKNMLPQPDKPFRLIDMAGGLEHSACFAGEPLAVQEALRREWD